MSRTYQCRALARIRHSFSLWRISGHHSLHCAASSSPLSSSRSNEPLSQFWRRWRHRTHTDRSVSFCTIGGHLSTWSTKPMPFRPHFWKLWVGERCFNWWIWSQRFRSGRWPTQRHGSPWASSRMSAPRPRTLRVSCHRFFYELHNDQFWGLLDLARKAEWASCLLCPCCLRTR